MDRITIEQRRKNMQAVKSTGSKIETELAKALFARGYRYRKNDKTIFGKPDLSFKKLKIAIFVDGEFWHGKDWNDKKKEIKSNQNFWHNKIEKNILRDKEVNMVLRESGWFVLRYWGKDVKNNLLSCVFEIEEIITSKKVKT